MTVGIDKQNREKNHNRISWGLFKLELFSDWLQHEGKPATYLSLTEYRRANGVTYVKRDIRVTITFPNSVLKRPSIQVPFFLFPILQRLTKYLQSQRSAFLVLQMSMSGSSLSSTGVPLFVCLLFANKNIFILCLNIRDVTVSNLVNLINCGIKVVKLWETLV